MLVRPWPVLLLSDWLLTTFQDPHYAGFFFLGGYKLDQWQDAQKMFKTFWERHAVVEPDVHVEHPSQTIPIMLHGDEGRGQGKRPILVVGYQPVIPWAGENMVNSEKFFGLHYW